MALEHGYPMKPFSMQVRLPSRAKYRNSLHSDVLAQFPWDQAICLVAFIIELGIFHRDGISNVARKPRNPETYLRGLGLSIVATLPWLYCHDALFPLECLNVSKDI